jgi:hypothetical protein
MSEPCLLPDIQKILRKIKGKYYLQEIDDPIPLCKGCFNVGASCGTPCATCERSREWTENWMLDLFLDERYIVWKRRK